MATTNKPKGGSVCAVSTCSNYSGKLRQGGIANISFHRFPKNLKFQKKWIQKCRRGDNWNPSTSFICSAHFKDDEFIRDLQAELLGYVPKGRRLKPEAIPSLNLPGHCIQGNKVSTSAINRNKRMEAKSSKQAHDEVISMALNTEIQSSSNQSILLCDSTEEPPKIIDYECLYRDLLKDHAILKTDLSLTENELTFIKDSNESCIRINESLRSQLKLLKKNINNLNIQIKKIQKSSSKQIKQLSVYKTKNIQFKKNLSSIFSHNQLDLIMKKKKKVHWSVDEISKALTLRYLSKQAYIFVKNDLNYPLPGISSLQRYAKRLGLRNGVYGDKINPCITSKHTYTAHVNDEESMVATALKQINLRLNNAEHLEGNRSNTESYNEYLQEIYKNKYEMEENVVEYLAGWVAKKYKVQFPELGLTTTQYNLEHIQEHDYQRRTWIHHLSYGGLVAPSQDFKNKTIRIERLFKKLTKNLILKKLGVVKYLTNKIFCRMEIEDKYKPVIETYIKQRIFIRMRYLNQHSKLLTEKQKRKAQLQKMQKLKTWYRSIGHNIGF